MRWPCCPPPPESSTSPARRGEQPAPHPAIPRGVACARHPGPGEATPARAHTRGAGGGGDFKQGPHLINIPLRSTLCDSPRSEPQDSATDSAERPAFQGSLCPVPLLGAQQGASALGSHAPRADQTPEAVPAAPRHLGWSARRVPQNLPCHPGGEQRRGSGLCPFSQGEAPHGQPLAPSRDPAMAEGDAWPRPTRPCPRVRSRRLGQGPSGYQRGPRG